MPPCDRCGSLEDLPYQCAYCGGTFCGEHRLPENHGCPGLDDWGDPDGIFDSGFDADVAKQEPGTGIADTLGLDTGPGGHLAYFRGNMTFVFLATMWVVFLLQQVTLGLFGAGTYQSIFVLRSTHIEYVWTWFTSIFAHDPIGFFHIIFNSIVLYFFGPIVERKIGSKNFTALFLGAGAIAGLSQVTVGLVLQDPGAVVGASGAILAIMGVLTVLNPQLRVLLFFIIPMPLWLLTAGFAAISVFVMVGGGIGAGSIAHMAHLMGLVIGLIYGDRLRRRGTSVPDQLQLGGGRRPPPGRGRR